MDLLPGPYRGLESYDQRIRIHEDAFWPLEPAIRRFCDRYVPDSHYGVTAISRDQWIAILAEWERLADLADHAVLPIEIAQLRALSVHLRREFFRDFRRNCAKLSRLIRRLTAQLRDVLQSYDEISILGI